MTRSEVRENGEADNTHHGSQVDEPADGACVAVVGDEGLDMPLRGPDGKALFSEAHVPWLVATLNEKHERNWAKTARFEAALRAALELCEALDSDALEEHGDEHFEEDQGAHEEHEAQGAVLRETVSIETAASLVFTKYIACARGQSWTHARLSGAWRPSWTPACSRRDSASGGPASRRAAARAPKHVHSHAPRHHRLPAPPSPLRPPILPLSDRLDPRRRWRRAKPDHTGLVVAL